VLGDNGRGQAGEPDPDVVVTDPVTTPYVLPTLTGCTALAAGAVHTCAVCNGAIECWGDDRLGQLGAGELSLFPEPLPREVASAVGDPFVEVAAGATFTCGRTQAGRGFCWGSSPHGALGTGTTAANLPAPVEHE
jgi:alpha-tubulin suppressor-like RCC1 family protein